MGSSNLGVCPKIFLVIFAIVNLLILFLGLASIGVGIYLIVDNQTFAFITGSSIVSGAAVLIIAGIVTGVIAAVGFIGAIFKLRILLLIYVIVLALIVVLEIVAGILGYVFRGELEDFARNRVGNITATFIQNYQFDQANQDRSDVNNAAVDGVQNTLQCCGAVVGPEDWLDLNPTYFNESSGRFPESCRCTLPAAGCEQFVRMNVGGRTVNETVWSMPCTNVTNDRVLALAYVAGGIGIAFGVIEIFGILVGLGLCCCITMADKEKDVV